MFISGPEILDQTNHTILKIVSKVGSPVGFLYIIFFAVNPTRIICGLTAFGCRIVLPLAVDPMRVS